MFPFLLVLEDGQPNDPAAFLTAARTGRWARRSQRLAGEQWRILGIDSDIDDELVSAGFNVVWTIEPV